MSRLAAARALLEAGNAAGAHSLLAPMLTPGSKEAEPYRLAADALTRQGRCEEALANYRAALERDPTRTLMEFSARGVAFRISDAPGSASGLMVLEELYADAYRLDDCRPEPRDVFLDIGAHIGGVSIYLARRYPQARIIAYEPSPTNFALLEANLARNQVANVEAVNRAVAGVGGQLRLVEKPGDTSGATGVLSAAVSTALAARGCRMTAVEAVTLEDVFLSHGIDRCRLLKLDCEGAEHGILADPRPFQRIDALALEVHVPPSQAHQSADEITEALLRPLRASGAPTKVRVASVVILAAC